MILSDMHVHSAFCDGVDTPNALCEQAVKIGVQNLGIVAHSYVDFDPIGTLSPDNTKQFIDTVNQLKQAYKGKLNVYCGVELDAMSNISTDDFDYVIGSLHYVKKDDKVFTFDNGETLFTNGVKEVFNGDYYAFCEKYFEMLADFVVTKKPDIVGHLDLVTKYNEGNKYFDTTNIRYQNAVKKAVDKMLNINPYFEVNYGSVIKGAKRMPYPEKWITDYILSKNGKLLLSTDAHKKENIGKF